MNFRVGQKVVHIDHGCGWKTCDGNPGKAIKPVHLAVYTIRDIETDPKLGQCLRLEEIHNDPVYYDGYGWCEPFYWHRDFRLATDMNTDISVFYEILDEVRSRTQDAS